MRAALLSLLCSGCLASSLATVGVDAVGTGMMAQRGWPKGRFESNPLLGPRPSVGMVTGYMALCEVGLVALDDALPNRWRWVLHTLVTSAEVVTLYRNTRCDMGHCGVSP